MRKVGKPAVYLEIVLVGKLGGKRPVICRNGRAYNDVLGAFQAAHNVLELVGRDYRFILAVDEHHFGNYLEYVGHNERAVDMLAVGLGRRDEPYLEQRVEIIEHAAEQIVYLRG